MTDKEKTSAFMDNDEMNDEFIQSLSQSENAKTWKNYHLISDVIRGDAPERKEWDIASNIALALENEPTYQLDNTTSDFMYSQPSPREAKKTLPSWLSQLSQVAVAACFSFVVILGVQQYNGVDNDDTSNRGDIPVLDTIPFSGTAEPVSLTRSSLTNKASVEADVTEQRKRINAMLQDYELQLRLNTNKYTPEYNLLKHDTVPTK